MDGYLYRAYGKDRGEHHEASDRRRLYGPGASCEFVQAAVRDSGALRRTGRSAGSAQFHSPLVDDRTPGCEENRPRPEACSEPGMTGAAGRFLVTILLRLERCRLHV